MPNFMLVMLCIVARDRNGQRIGRSSARFCLCAELIEWERLCSRYEAYDDMRRSNT